MMKISRVINIIIALFLLILSLNILVKSIVNNTIDAITIIVSTIIIILSLTVLVYLLKYRKNRENSSDKKISSILKDGYKVQAKFLGILNYYLGRDRHYFVICSWLNPSDHKNYIFSRVLEYNMHYDATEKLKQNELNFLDVYIDKKNFKNYYIDLKPIEGWKE